MRLRKNDQRLAHPDRLAGRSRKHHIGGAVEGLIQQIGAKHATYGPRNAAEVERVRAHHQGWPG